MSINEIINSIINWLKTEGVKLLFSLLVLYIVFKIINFITRRIDKKISLKKKHFDETITKVSLSLLNKGLKFIAFVCFLGYVGIETSSIAAAITSAGLAIGLALQGSLSNFAGGVIILIMRPYKLKDYIACNGVEGTVEDIKLFYTYITTIDNKVIVLPNGKIADSLITNYSSKKLRRLDMTFNVSYSSDIETAKKSIMNCINKSNLIKKNIEPFVNVNQYGDSYIQLILKVWCNNSDYWELYYYFQEEVKKEFENNNVAIAINELKIEVNK